MQKNFHQISSSSTPLLENEEREINQKIDAELADSQLKMVTLGGIANSLAAIFVAFVLYGKVKLLFLLIWLISLFIVNAINIGISYFYKNEDKDPDQYKLWRKKYYFVLMILCLIWGCEGVLYLGKDINYNLFVIVILLINLVAFGIGTITDFKAAVISLTCLVVPYVSYQIYLEIYLKYFLKTSSSLNLIFAGSLLIIASFLLLISYVGYHMTKKFFRMNFLNIVLNKKLEGMNITLIHQANHDSLTGVANRNLLNTIFGEAIKKANRNNKSIAILFLDLDDFKKVNDNWGHQIGDELLKYFVKKLSQSVRENDLIIRLGGDEFVILLEDIVDKLEVTKLANRIFQNLAKPSKIQGHTIFMASSIGVSFYPEHGKDLGELLQQADQALYQAKSKGKGIIHFFG